MGKEDGAAGRGAGAAAAADAACAGRQAGRRPRGKASAGEGRLLGKCSKERNKGHGASRKSARRGWWVGTERRGSRHGASSGCHVANPLQVGGQLPAAGQGRAGGQRGQRQGSRQHAPCRQASRLQAPHMQAVWCRAVGAGTRSAGQGRQRSRGRALRQGAPAGGAQGGILHPAGLHQGPPVRLTPLWDGQPQLAQAQGCRRRGREGQEGLLRAELDQKLAALESVFSCRRASKQAGLARRQQAVCGVPPRACPRSPPMS